MKDRRTPKDARSRLLFLGKLPQVELQLLALKDVAVHTTRLAWPRRDDRMQSAPRELLIHL